MASEKVFGISVFVGFYSIRPPTLPTNLKRFQLIIYKHQFIMIK